MSIKKDKYFITLANNLAQSSKGYTGSNPSVGAVVVKKNQVISFASTSLNGRPHAEKNALKNISLKNKKGSSIYISLEPCAHHGKTPPCVNEIIKSKIKRVVYSIKDPDIRTSGKSFKILKSNKIKVKKDINKKIAKSIYKNYFYSKTKNKPYLYGKLAISKDSFLKDKKKFYLTNKFSLQTVHVIRSKVNCILTTSKTVNDDNPRLNCRINGLEKLSPQIAIIDKNLTVNKSSFLISNAKNNRTFIFFNKYNKKKINFLNKKKITTIYTPMKKNFLDFDFILKKLYDFEINTILVEGGKSITNFLISRNLFNEFYLFVSSHYLKNRGFMKVNNIRSKLSNKFKNIKFDETYLDKDRLIHYY